MARICQFDRIAATLSFDPAVVTPEVYVASVLDIVEAQGWWADGIDWPTARREMLAVIGEQPTMDTAHQALAALLGKLRIIGDNHFYMILPDELNFVAEQKGYGLLLGGNRVIAVYQDGPAARSGIVVGDVIEEIEGRPPAPYEASDPGWSGPSSATFKVRRNGVAAPFTVTLERATYDRYLPPTGQELPAGVRHIAIPGFGSGGGIPPMIAALGPILGNGAFGGFLYRDDRQIWSSYEDGRIVDDIFGATDFLDGQAIPALQNPRPPVAVLTSRYTASAGEMTAIAFVGRPDTRLFGTFTSGHTTANVSLPLFDGAMFVLSVAAMTDRIGETHLGGIAPDEIVSTNWSTYGTADDPVIAAATAWLQQQPACAIAPAATPVPAG